MVSKVRRSTVLLRAILASLHVGSLSVCVCVCVCVSWNCDCRASSCLFCKVLKHSPAATCLVELRTCIQALSLHSADTVGCICLGTDGIFSWNVYTSKFACWPVKQDHVKWIICLTVVCHFPIGTLLQGHPRISTLA